MSDNSIPSVTALSMTALAEKLLRTPGTAPCIHLSLEGGRLIAADIDALRERERRLRELLTTLRHCGANDCGECADVRAEMAELLVAKEGDVNV
jgi:hypothetical protein